MINNPEYSLKDGSSSDVIKRFEKYLNSSDKVILADVDDVKIMDGFLGSKALNDSTKQLSVFWTGTFSGTPGKHIYLTISEKEMGLLLNFYRCYEASDSITILSDKDNNYGTMWNYVRTGVLTLEDYYYSVIT